MLSIRAGEAARPPTRDPLRIPPQMIEIVPLVATMHWHGRSGDRLYARGCSILPVTLVAGAVRDYNGFMFDVQPSTIQRAISILRHGAMSATQFATKMWPERSSNRTPGQQSRAGHALLRHLARLGYVQKIGDLWTLRTAGTAVGLGDSAVQTGVTTAVGLGVALPVGPAVGPAVGLAVGPAVAPSVGPMDGLAVGPADAVAEGLPERLSNEPPRTPQEQQADLDRLHRLVRLADQPVEGVVCDAALGDIEVRGWPLDNFLAQACAWTVLRGRAQNVYPSVDSDMLVGLTPIESARALHLRWAQSGQPPGLLDPDYWFVASDGLIADPMCWVPQGCDDPDLWFSEVRTGAEQIQRQRERAGLA